MSVPITKQAAILLRVSSRGQVETDYDPEGLSLPAQRVECERKAAAVGAKPVLEYIEPGVSGGLLIKRKVFRQMLADIRERGDIDYVIVWSVSRWARNQEDHWTARGMINRAGAKLIAVKEPIGEDTSHGVVVEGVMAAVAAGRRIEISEEVTRGIKRKVEVGGFPGYAPLGYRNVREPLPHGGEVRTIAIDEERAIILRWGFVTYATGLYSITDMVTLLAARGLRSRGNRRYGPRRLNHSAVHALLSNPFYMGKFFYKGKLYQGRHEPLISEELFEKVQTVLKAHQLSGERDRKHHHYLKGTIRCDCCNHRLVYSRAKGNGGTYEYFACPINQRRECTQRVQRVDAVEAAIEQHYKTVTLTKHDQDLLVREMERYLAKQAATSKQEITHCENLLADLREQERKLMGKYYADQISEEFFAEEAERIKVERADAAAIVDRLNVGHQELRDFLALALTLAASDLYDLYLRANPHVRRLMNQALFEAIWVWDENETHSELASPFKQIHAIAKAQRRIGQQDRSLEGLETADDPEPFERIPVGVGATEAKNDEVPDSYWEEAGDFDTGLIRQLMVGAPGFEPGTSRV